MAAVEANLPSSSYFTPQVRPGPRDLLVRFHRRAGLPERQRDPAKGLLPLRHRHPLPRQPGGPAVTGAQMKGGEKTKSSAQEGKQKTED